MLIILDRDGVINVESNAYIKSPKEWVPIPGSLEAIAKLKKAGYTVVIATNQSGIARGLFTQKTLQKIHKKLLQALSHWGVTLDGIFYCPHQPSDFCSCRKPAPGLLQTIGKAFNEELTEAICIGDSLRDITAAEKVGAQPMLVLTGNGERTVIELQGKPLPVYADLAHCVEAILVK